VGGGKHVTKSDRWMDGQDGERERERRTKRASSLAWLQQKHTIENLSTYVHTNSLPYRWIGPITQIYVDTYVQHKQTLCRIARPQEIM